MIKTLGLFLTLSLASFSAIADHICTASVDVSKLGNQELVDVAAAGGLGKCIVLKSQFLSIVYGEMSDEKLITSNDSLDVIAVELRDLVAAGICFKK